MINDIFKRSQFFTLITELSENLHHNAVKHGLWDSTNKAEKIALMQSELSEVLEAVREGGRQIDKHCPYYEKEAVELADVIIRVLDYCHFYCIPIAQAIIAKAGYNETHPYKHGKAF